MPSPLAAHLARLKRVRATLVHGRAAFWEAHRTEYRDQCAEVLEQQLALMRPPTEEPVAWAANARALAQAVADRLVADDEMSGLLIFVSSQNLPPIGGPLEDFLTRDTVLRWVQAGRQGDPLGKHFDQEDFLRDDRHIAGLVYWSILQGKAQHTPAALREWIEQKSLAHLRPYMAEILKAWRLSLVDRVRADFRAWVGGVARGGAAGGVE